MISLNKMDENILRGKLLKKHKKLPNGCWQWTGWNYGGYGYVRVDGRAERVHRMSMMIFRPDDFVYFLLVCHRCNNKLCINPDHLYSGTSKDNYRDEVANGHILSNGYGNRDKCLNGHEYISGSYFIGTKGDRIRKKCRLFRRLYRIRKPKKEVTWLTQ